MGNYALNVNDVVDDRYRNNSWDDLYPCEQHQEPVALSTADLVELFLEYRRRVGGQAKISLVEHEKESTTKLFGKSTKRPKA